MKTTTAIQGIKGADGIAGDKGEGGEQGRGGRTSQGLQVSCQQLPVEHERLRP